MRIIICLLLMTQICSAQVVLHRYYDTITGEEQGISYSSKSGNPANNNPDWTVEVIDESQAEFYRKEHRKQINARLKAIKDDLKAKRKDIKTKLKALGLTQNEVDILVGESN